MTHAEKIDAALRELISARNQRDAVQVTVPDYAERVAAVKRADAKVKMLLAERNKEVTR